MISNSPAIDPPYPVYGGFFREEAIMLLRRFYIQENEKGKCGIRLDSGWVCVGLISGQPQNRDRRRIEN